MFSGSAGDGIMRLKEFIVERITLIKFGVNDRGSNGTGS